MAFEMIQAQLKEEFTYELYLCKSSYPYDTIGCLTNAITDTSFRWVLREPDELSFIMHEKFEDGSVNSLFSQIIETNTIKVDKIIDDVIIESYLYHISSVEPIGGISNSKNIKAYSLEIRLNKRTVRAFEYSTQIYTGIWNSATPATSGIVDYILTLFDGNWTVNYVSPSLLNSVRKFDIMQSKCLEAIRIIEDNFNCIFMYDTVNQTINIVAYDDNYNGFNNNSGLILDNMNYLEQYNSQIDVDDIVTRLTIEGEKDVNIAGINITGQRYIDDFSFFMNTKYMTQGLITALNNIETLKTNNTAIYQGLLSTLDTKQGELITLQGELFTLNTELIIIEDSEDLAIRNGGTYNAKTYSQWHTDLLAKKGAITTKEGQITTKLGEIVTVNSNIDTLAYLVSYDNPLNLTNTQRKELVNFIQEDTQNIKSEDPDVLLQLGQAYMTIKAQSQYDISVNMVDVFSVKSESYAWDKLILGSKVNLIINDVVYEPIITSIDHGWDSNSLNITVSNKLYLNDDMDFLTSLWAKTKSTSTVFDKNIGDLKNSSEIAKELEADKSNPINVKDNVITIGDEAALVQQAQITRRGLYTGDSLSANGQMRILSDMIVFTNDNWNSHSVAIDSTGIRTSGSFRLQSDNLSGGINLVTIDGDGIVIHGGESGKGFEIKNKTNQTTFSIDSNGNVVLGQGSITWNNVNTDPVASGAASTANSALNTANAIRNGTSVGGTFIDGRTVYSGSIFTNNSGMTSSDSAGKYLGETGYVPQNSDIRFWAGSSFNDRANSNTPFRVTQGGKVTASDIDIVGGSINISTNATVGSNLILGNGSQNGRIDFKSGAIIVADIGFAGIRVSASDFNVSDGNIKLGNTGSGVTTEIIGSIKMGVVGSPATVDFTYSTLVGLQVKFA